MGTPVRLGPLGEGPGALPDPEPRINLKEVDCVTYVEQCLALALDEAVRDPVEALDRIRYRNGQVGFLQRNHYMVLDWIPNNRWIVRDVTSEIGAGNCRELSRTIPKGAFFRNHGTTGYDGPEAVTRQILYLPSEALRRIEPRLEAGQLTILLGDRPEIFARHCGILDRDGQGTLLLRHASLDARRVIEEPLTDYIERHPWCLGFLILDLR
jgi:D-alanyl-D-alanine carboxypeptidase/D-alanyl-D-alanine-endopeptidase (penicillin-binding protein 4)